MSFPPPQTIQKELAKNRINTVSANPIRQSPRRLPFGKRQVEEQELKKMLKQNVIESSNSTWSFPAVLVTKKDCV